MGRYNTRKKIRERSPAINPVFSRGCGEFNNKIYQLLNILKQVKSQLGFEEELYVMKEKKSTNKISVSISLAFGILSLFSFVLYFYSANHAPYTYIDVIFLGPLFSFIGIVISIITRKSRKIHPVLWISGIISCMLSFIVCTFVFIVLIMLMAAK